VSGKAAESTQVGVEWIGAAGVEADCELLALCQAALGELALQDWQLVVSHARFAPAYLVALGVEETALSGLLRDLGQGNYVGVQEQLRSLSIDPAVLHELSSLEPFDPDSFPYDRIDWEASSHGRTVLAAWQELTELAAALRRQGLADGVAFDLALHRDPAYYTGMVFEVFAPGVGAPIAYGGRYDHLLGQFGAEAPAIGFTFELERLLTVLTEGAWLQSAP
jgi:ATP phosphoribosyltransferase regulatory subunit